MVTITMINIPSWLVIASLSASLVLAVVLLLMLIIGGFFEYHKSLIQKGRDEQESRDEKTQESHDMYEAIGRIEDTLSTKISEIADEQFELRETLKEKGVISK